MVISNAKYGKKTGNIKNRAFLAQEDEAMMALDHEAGDFIVPRYEEMKFLSVEELTV